MRTYEQMLDDEPHLAVKPRYNIKTVFNDDVDYREGPPVWYRDIDYSILDSQDDCAINDCDSEDDMEDVG